MLQSLSEFWNETMLIPEARWIVGGTVLVLTVLLAVYVSTFFRNLATGRIDVLSNDWLSEFRRMRDQGHIADEEFSKLKTVIPNKQESNIGKLQAVAMDVAEQNEPEKKYLTLAEAQQQKQAKLTANETNQDDEAKESE